MSKTIAPVLIIMALFACAAADRRDVPADLQAAISRANDSFVRATRTLDVDRLSEHFGGDILKSLSASIARAQQEQRYAISKLNRIEWLHAELNRDSANVMTIENWSHRHLRVGTSECLFEIAGRDVKQTYHLKRSGDRWRIVGITDDPANAPAQRTACGHGTS